MVISSFVWKTGSLVFFGVVSLYQSIQLYIIDAFLHLLARVFKTMQIKPFYMHLYQKNAKALTFAYSFS